VPNFIPFPADDIHGGSLKPKDLLKERKWLVAILAVYTIVAAGLLAYNMDALYLADQVNLTSSIPDRLVANRSASFAVSLSDGLGKPLAGEAVEVLFSDNGTETRLAQGVTDAGGFLLVSFHSPGESGDGEVVVKAAGEQLTRSVEVLREELVDTRVLVATDKPLYQPGQLIHVRLMVFGGAAGGALNTSATVEVVAPTGDKIFKKVVNTSDFGVAALDYPLSDQLPLGAYKIRVSAGGKEVEKSVVVDRYVLPKFTIALSGLEDWYTVDEPIIGTLDANYVFGKVVKGEATITAEVYHGVWVKYFEQTYDMVNGSADFYIDEVEYAVGIPFYDFNGLVKLNVSVEDTAGHNETKSVGIPIASDPLVVTTVPDTNVPGYDSTYHFIVQYPDGEPVGSATIRIGDDDAAVTNGKGVAEYTFDYTGQPSLGLSVNDGVYHTYETIMLLESDGIKLTSDSAYYEVGQLAEFGVAYAGESLTKWAYYDVVSKGFTIATGTVELDSGRGSLEVPISPDMVGTSQVRVYKIGADGNTVRDVFTFGVAPTSGVDVEITADKPVYEPHQAARLDFLVTKDGAGVPAALGVSAVDRSIFELSERYGGLEDLFWDLEDEFLEPQYQIVQYVYSDASSLSLAETSEVSLREVEGSFQTTWDANSGAALEAKEGAVSLYWSVIIIVAALAFVALLVFTRKFKVIAIVGLMVAIGIVVTAVAVVSVNQMTVDTGDVAFDGPRGGGDDWGAERMVQEAAPGPQLDFGFGQKGELAANEMVTGGTEQSTLPPKEDTRVRSYFPETWVWQPLLLTDDEGRASLDLLTPDSITTWEVKAVASTQAGNLGVGNANLTVFQEFFVEPDLPVSIVQNDTFPLRVLAYNYANETRNVFVELENDTWFDLTGEGNATFDLGSEETAGVEFVITARDVGWHYVNVSANDEHGWDRVSRPIWVEPRGKLMETTINGQITDNQTVTETVKFNASRVPDSEDIYLKLQAGVESVALDGAEEYIQFVSGCGEQSMSTLSIDVLAFRLVAEEGTVEQMFEYETIVTQGIAHELMYLKSAQNGEGRGIVWFPDDRDVHPWLTSWGLITFRDAIDAGFEIDDAIVTDMQSWLVSQQKSDGSFEFPEWGLYEFTNPNLRSKRVACTAYVTRALVYSGYDASGTAISDAMSYLESNYDEHMDDAYTLAVTLLTLEMAGGSASARDAIASRLLELRSENATDGTAYWDSDTNLLSDGEPEYYYGYSSRTIETTGYAIMALRQHGGSQSVVRLGVKYLLTHRMGGGYFSTQDTVVAFQAIIAGGENDVQDVTVRVLVEGAEVDAVRFTPANNDVTYFTDLRPWLADTMNVTLESVGSGSILYQIIRSEYVPWELVGVEASPLTLDVSYSAENITVGNTITATATLRYTGDYPLKMVLVDVRAPVGFSFVEWSFGEMLDDGVISMYEVSGRQAYLYVEDVHGTTLLSYRLSADMPITGTLQGVKAWDMYNPRLEDEVGPVEFTADIS